MVNHTPNASSSSFCVYLTKLFQTLPILARNPVRHNASTSVAVQNQHHSIKPISLRPPRKRSDACAAYARTVPANEKLPLTLPPQLFAQAAHRLEKASPALSCHPVTPGTSLPVKWYSFQLSTLFHLFQPGVRCVGWTLLLSSSSARVFQIGCRIFHIRLARTQLLIGVDRYAKRGGGKVVSNAFHLQANAQYVGPKPYHKQRTTRATGCSAVGLTSPGAIHGFRSSGLLLSVRTCSVPKVKSRRPTQC